RLTDPQERLFLQHAWMAIEDAGYTRAALQTPCENDLPGQVGVYVGVMYSEYQLFGAEASARGKRLGIVGSAASIANRVSYVLNLHGPSVTLDTMCSSSLTAIHLACLDLKLGRTSMAIAGGVNVSIHPNKYLVLSAGQFISSDGHCQSFGEGGDGYIPGEGVGAVVLKRLSDARRDGDHIYAVIRGSALNHGGKMNGYTVPNPQAQASVISRALAEARIDARHVTYIEAHGTGTKLGDPIEIAALTKAFRQYTGDNGFCLVGSAKSNIGHCESAAGIAGLTKVLLQMQHREVVPSLHSAQLNPHIDFTNSPFIVNQTLRPWEPPVIDGRELPRIAGISSFGAGGSNAHILLEEYPVPVTQPAESGSVLIVLSARTAEQLQEKARTLLAFLRPRQTSLDLSSVAYTLQVGREAMDERLAFVVTSTAQLVDKLQKYTGGEKDIDDFFSGQAKRNKEALSLFSAGGELQQAVEKWIAGGKLTRLADAWVRGLDIDWSRLYGRIRPQRVSLPVYPFARERYWVDLDAVPTMTVSTPAAAQPSVASVLHPLLHDNTSDLDETSYTSRFSGDEIFLKGHSVDGRSTLPPAAYLEIARAAAEKASRVFRDAAVELRDVVWSQPLSVLPNGEIRIVLLASASDEIEIEICGKDGADELILCQARAVASREPDLSRIDIIQLERRMDGGALDAAAVYEALARMGTVCGPEFQGIESVRLGSNELLARLRLPQEIERTAGDYGLHPALLEGALHAAAGLNGEGRWLAEARSIESVESMTIVRPVSGETLAWVRYAKSGSQDGVVRTDVDLFDTRGEVCVRMRGVSWSPAV
ncbi:MAG TPA: type I polyketide synthase, partial [Thermoanaerobaculia bacterium]|nr:type I polyketide synthase [Thermoanaerobaculia bacterium]